MFCRLCILNSACWQNFPQSFDIWQLTKDHDHINLGKYKSTKHCRSDKQGRCILINYKNPGSTFCWIRFSAECICFPIKNYSNNNLYHAYTMQIITCKIFTARKAFPGGIVFSRVCMLIFCRPLLHFFPINI